MALAAALVALRVAAADPADQAAEGIRVACGARFAEVRFSTSTPCVARVELSCAGEKLVVRGREASTQHRLIVPLAPGRPSTVRVLTPDGTPGPQSSLRAALAARPALSVAQRSGPDGTLEVLARSDVDALWSAFLRRGAELERIAGPAEASRVATFTLGALAPEGELQELRIQARFVDGALSARTERVLGNARLARVTRDALGGMNVARLAQLLVDPRAKQAAFATAYTSEAARVGLEAPLDGALTRAMDLCADSRLDGPGLRLPFSYALLQLGSLAQLASLRGWPLPGRGARALECTPLSYPKAPPEDAWELHSSKLWHACATWPGRAAGGPAAATIARLSEPRGAKELTDALVEAVPGVLSLVNRGKPFQGATLNIQEEWLQSPSGAVTLLVETAGLEPDDVLNINLGDRAIVALRNRRDTYPGSPLQKLEEGKPLSPSMVVGNWVGCRLPARLFSPGKNRIIVTAESLDSLKTMLGFVMFRHMRLARAD